MHLGGVMYRSALKSITKTRLGVLEHSVRDFFIKDITTKSGPSRALVKPDVDTLCG